MIYDICKFILLITHLIIFIGLIYLPLWSFFGKEISETFKKDN